MDYICDTCKARSTSNRKCPRNGCAGTMRRIRPIDDVPVEDYRQKPKK
jgi:hypothetical protein